MISVLLALVVLTGACSASRPSAGASVDGASEGSVAARGSEEAPPAIEQPGPERAAPATAAEPERGRLVVHATGDVNLDPSYIQALASQGYAYAWAGVEDLFTQDDLTIVNMECAVSDLGEPLPKQFNFRCDTDALPDTRAAGVEVANLANNHGRDFGAEALLDSVENLRRAGLVPVGVGADAAEAGQPALFDINGWKVAVLGFGGVVESPDWLAGPDHPGMADGDDAVGMAAAVAAADEVADLVFVTVHWGTELDTWPRPEDVERAEAMIDAGADAIFGHHAHRLQPLSWYADRPIAWGLGNFVWPNFSEAGSRSAVAEVVVEPDGSIGACLIPAFIHAPGQPILTGEYTGPCAPTPDMERPPLR